MIAKHNNLLSALIKILHTADLHLDSPLKSLALRDDRLSAQVQTATRTAFQRLMQRAIDESVSAVLIAGDLFDGKERSAKTAAFLVSEFSKLGAAGIQVFYIKGNHDAENPIAGAFELPSNVHVFEGRGGKVRLNDVNIWIHGVSFSGKHAPDSLLPKYGPPVQDAINIGLMHTSLSGASGHDPYAPCTVAQLQNHGFDYWALGHIHKRDVHLSKPWVVMPGIPQGRDIGESGPKSATLLSIDTSGARSGDTSPIQIEEIFVAPVVFQKSQCDVSGVENDDDLRARFRAHFEAEASETKADAAILRLTLSGQTSRAWHIRRDADVWEAIIKDLAEQTGVLWVEKIDFDVTDVSNEGDTLGVLSRVLMVHYFPSNGRMSYGPGSTRERHND
jgi:DNA repair protein SbcD/Mre11